MDEPNILKSYKDMHIAFEKYIDRIDLFEEVKMLNTINNNLSELYPLMIILVSLKLCPTIPITVASAEQLFSKLKLLNMLPYYSGELFFVFVISRKLNCREIKSNTTIPIRLSRTPLTPDTW